MGQDHLLRLNVPKSWPIEKKETKYIARAIPGPHSLNGSMPLGVLMRFMLKCAKTRKEVKKILNEGGILVNKLARKDEKFPVGFMDIIEVPMLKENYRLVYNKRGFFSLIQISMEESNLKLLKIVRKNMVKGGLVQLTFHDGRTIASKKSDCKVGDSVLFDLKSRKAVKTISIEPGALIFLNGGAHIGHFGKIKEVIKSNDLQKPKVMFEINGKGYSTDVEYAFVVGKDRPEILLGDEK